jgi:hypothetical protein
MNFLIKAFVSDGSQDDYECALLRVEEATAKRIAAAQKQLLALRQRDELADLMTLALFDQSALFFAQWRLGDPLETKHAPPAHRRDLLSADQRRRFEADLPVVLAEPLDLYRDQEGPDETFDAVECERLVVAPHSCWWQALYEEDSVYVSTVGIAYDSVVALSHCAAQATGHGASGLEAWSKLPHVRPEPAARDMIRDVAAIVGTGDGADIRAIVERALRKNPRTTAHEIANRVLKVCEESQRRR